MTDFVLKTYLSDLTDAELMTRPGDKSNHLAWQIGHLIASESQMRTGICPESPSELPAGFAEQHERAMIGENDPKRFLSKQRYVELYERQRRATRAALDALPEAALDQPAPEQFRSYAPTVGAVFNLIASHPMMHAGQFAAARRMLGKPVLI